MGCTYTTLREKLVNTKTRHEIKQTVPVHFLSICARERIIEPEQYFMIHRENHE